MLCELYPKKLVFKVFVEVLHLQAAQDLPAPFAQPLPSLQGTLTPAHLVQPRKLRPAEPHCPQSQASEAEAGAHAGLWGLFAPC
jgi:hypothetical protein